MVLRALLSIIIIKCNEKEQKKNRSKLKRKTQFRKHKRPIETINSKMKNEKKK